MRLRQPNLKLVILTKNTICGDGVKKKPKALPVFFMYCPKKCPHKQLK